MEYVERVLYTAVLLNRYSGDENGLMSVLKFDAEEGKILQLPYHVPVNAVKGKNGQTSGDIFTSPP